MHRIGCEYLMPAVIIAFPFIKVYSWKNIPPSVFGRYIFLFLWAVRSGARVRKVSLGSAPRADTRKSVCGAGFGERLTTNNCSKKRFFQLGIKTARRARKRGVFGNHKTNYVVKTTELGRKPRGGRGKGVFSGIAKRITLLKQRNWGGNRAAGAETGCFGNSQNELRCKNNGIRGETARWARK